MKQDKKRKYCDIVKDLTGDLWQEMLKSNLKIQDDHMHFVNTPDFKKTMPIKSS